MKNIQIWRFSIYYFFVFGAFVALALWLPRYLIGVYGLDIRTAGVLTAFYAVPASLFRAYGGHLSDKYGARTVMYLTFGVSIVCTFMLSYPQTDYVIHGIEGPIAFTTRMGLVPFVITIFVLGFFMSLGKAAVYQNAANEAHKRSPHPRYLCHRNFDRYIRFTEVIGLHPYPV